MKTTELRYPSPLTMMTGIGAILTAAAEAAAESHLDDVSEIDYTARLYHPDIERDEVGLHITGPGVTANIILTIDGIGDQSFAEAKVLFTMIELAKDDKHIDDDLLLELRHAGFTADTISLLAPRLEGHALTAFEQMTQLLKPIIRQVDAMSLIGDGTPIIDQVEDKLTEIAEALGYFTKAAPVNQGMPATEAA